MVFVFAQGVTLGCNVVSVCIISGHHNVMTDKLLRLQQGRIGIHCEQLEKKNMRWIVLRTCAIVTNEKCLTSERVIKTKFWYNKYLL